MSQGSASMRRAAGNADMDEEGERAYTRLKHCCWKLELEQCGKFLLCF
jgi:hypothetical protein